MSFDQALALARAANRTLEGDRARLAIARLGLQQARNVLFPTLTAQGQYTRNNTRVALALPNPALSAAGAPLTIQPIDQLDGAISFSTLLLAPSAYTTVKATASAVSAAECERDASEDAVLFTVAETFYAAAGADDLLLARSSNVGVARLTLQNAQERYAVEAVTKIDVDRAELAVITAEQAKREAEVARDQVYRALSTLIGVHTPFTVAVAAPAMVEEKDEAPSLPTVEEALRLHPEVRALEATLRLDELQRLAASWRWAPSLSAFGHARVFNYRNFAGDSYAWAAGATLDWVIYDGGSRDTARSIAEAQRAEAVAKAAEAADRISDDLANGRQRLDLKYLAQRTAERSVALARETIALIREQYETGAATQVDVLQAQDALMTAQELLAQAHFDVALADLALRRAAGTFPGDRGKKGGH